MSKFRLVRFIAFIKTVIALAAWFTFAPYTVAQTDLTLPFVADSYEPVRTAIHVPSTPVERAAAFSLLERALQNSDMHMAGTPPFYLEASFAAGGGVANVGSGNLTEAWRSGQSWLWTAKLGGYSQIQIGLRGTTYAEKKVAAPLRVQMLRSAIFWPVRLNSAAALRTAAIQWHGKPATCILVSGVTGSATETQVRLWEETEYCVDNATGLLQVYSVAPGSYALYSYAENSRFHGRYIPDQITFFMNGARILDSQIRITDLGSVDDSLFDPTPQMKASGPAITLKMPERFPIVFPSASVAGAIKPVIVHCSIDINGNVLEEELASASDPALAQIALDLVQKTNFSAQGVQRQAYINVRFTPAAE